MNSASARAGLVTALLMAVLAVTLTAMMPAHAEIYRYRDEQGNWVFTDRPPPARVPAVPVVPGADQRAEPQVRIEPLPPATGSAMARGKTPAGQASEPPAPTPAPTPVGAAPAKSSSAVGAEPPQATAPRPWAAALPPAEQPPAPPDPRPNLSARLMLRFDPVTPVETSSLAVVTVHSELGTGSGFFVSEDGLLLTNRHVVRPPPDWGATEMAALAVLKSKLDALAERLSLPRDRYSDPTDYDRGRRVFRERSRAYRQAKRALEMQRNAALLQHAFEIQLKDGETLTAELVEVSTAYDLALLRVSGYRTPFVRPLLGAHLRQTQPVYAIGSPLGIKDTVTAGTYTGQRDGMLVTDARIMPGNSGGPLVTETGFTVGINTWKATPEPDAKARGFGVSIPIDVAFQEFADLRALRGTDTAQPVAH